MSDSDHNVHAQHERTYQPKIKHERRIEKRSGTMVTNQPARAEISDFGSLKKIVGPPHWKKITEDQGGLATRAAELFHPPEDVDVQINAFYRGVPIDENSGRAFGELLNAQLKEGEARTLSPDQIKSLMLVMGLTTIGDNQYTNNSPKGSRDFPAFNLASAELVALNGRTVLKCRGNFQNDKAIPGTEYTGFFFPSKGNPREIEELFYQAPTRGKFLRFANEFETCLKTVEWY